MNAANAGYSQTNGSFNAYNSHGGSAHGTYQSTTHNSCQSYSAQQLANAQMSADFAMIRAEGQNNLAALKGSVIKDNTLMPGEWYGGTIVLDAPKKSKSWGDQLHRLNIGRRRNSSIPGEPAQNEIANALAAGALPSSLKVLVQALWDVPAG
jgi:hypothetical protein